MWNKFLGVLIENLPKALIGLLIPLAQWAWAKYRASDREEARKKIRARLAELGAQRDALSKILDLPRADQVLKDLNCEIEEVLSQLSGNDVPRVANGNARRSWAARWLLVFNPSSGWARVLHLLFFFNIATVLLGILGVVAEWGSGDEGFAVFGMLILLSPAYFFRRVALRLDRKHNSGESVPAEPPRMRLPRRTWFTRLIFCIAILFGTGMWIYAVFGDDGAPSITNLQENWIIALPTSAFFALTAICARGWSRASDSAKPHPFSRVRTALLLFSPSSPMGWVPIAAWHLGWAVAAFGTFRQIQDGFTEDDMVALAYLMPMLTAHLLCAWKWAQSFRSGPIILGNVQQSVEQSRSTSA